MPSYGNCYVFNSVLLDGQDEDELRVASLTGPKFGLKLVLNVEQTDYMVNSLTKEVRAFRDGRTLAKNSVSKKFS